MWNKVINKKLLNILIITGVASVLTSAQNLIMHQSLEKLALNDWLGSWLLTWTISALVSAYLNKVLGK